MAVLKTTPSYQAYMQAKSRGGAVIEDPEPRITRGPERRIDIQPAEDEDDIDDGLSIKHIAHARYSRNHRLINDIFSEVALPNGRFVVTTERIETFKRQLNDLSMHQKKLASELEQAEEEYLVKKQKFVESSEEFGRELKRHCSQVGFKTYCLNI